MTTLNLMTSCSTVLPTPEELIVTNLELLGFHNVTKDLVPPLEFTPTSFQRPNEPLLYAILHFLFKLLDRKKSRLVFQDCWPIVTRTTKAPFKRAVQKWLAELEADDKLPTGLSQASRIQTASGPRTVDLIWHLSNHVLQHALEKQDPASLVDLKALSVSDEKLPKLQMLIERQKERFKRDVLYKQKQQNSWKEMAADLALQIRELSVKTQDETTVTKDCTATELRQQIDEILKGWKEITDEKIHSSMKELDTLLKNLDDFHVIHNPSDLNKTISSLLAHVEILQERIENDFSTLLSNESVETAKENYNVASNQLNSIKALQQRLE